MIFWIITAIIVFFSLRWLVTVPCLIKKRTLIPKAENKQYYGDQYDISYVPIGMRIWVFASLILVSLCPVLNIIAFIVAWIVFFIYRAENLQWNEVFPKGAGRFLGFLNKTL